MKREQALNLLHEYVKNPRMIAHCLSSEAVLRALAKRLGEDPDKWGLAGLLHDLDVELTEGDLHTHAMETSRILKEQGLADDVVEAIMLHNEDAAHGRSRSTPFHHALAAGETITGLITATALVYPDKKVGSVKPKSVVKRMKEKAFAASVRRETILECEKIGIPLPEFAELSLRAMQEIAPELGL
ncbi:MAG: HD domain-containing protein [Bacteroidales bacterium]|jgi:putative nucleotidyltransferase with HDIG domain|nr:HD domain-containing protein [Bacteroidales bacterium]NLM92575.1 HD domain-containing protein [Bacteroidales bacterium]